MNVSKFKVFGDAFMSGYLAEPDYSILDKGKLEIFFSSLNGIKLISEIEPSKSKMLSPENNKNLKLD